MFLQFFCKYVGYNDKLRVEWVLLYVVRNAKQMKKSKILIILTKYIDKIYLYVLL